MKTYRFILDVHLGKLARMLRMVGFDSVYRDNLEDDEIIDIAEKECRIILTRDRGILSNSKVKNGHFVNALSPKEQLREIVDTFNLKESFNFLSRCMVCNGSIVDVSKEDVEKELKPDTYQYYNKFYRCNDCNRIYWEGSHYNRMLEFFKKIK